MSVHIFHIKFKSDGAHLVRAEWGKTREEALETLNDAYGEGTFEVIE